MSSQVKSGKMGKGAYWAKCSVCGAKEYEACRAVNSIDAGVAPDTIVYPHVARMIDGNRTKKEWTESQLADDKRALKKGIVLLNLVIVMTTYILFFATVLMTDSNYIGAQGWYMAAFAICMMMNVLNTANINIRKSIASLELDLKQL